MIVSGNGFGGNAVSAHLQITDAYGYGGSYWRPRVGGVRAG